MDAFIGKLSMDARRAIGLAGGLVDRLDALAERRVGLRAG
jgi:hypothetical protein